MVYLLAYLVTINALGYLLMRADKKNARRKKWRIPELVLLGIALFGGSIGVFFGMVTFHHKTRKEAFTIGVPLMMAGHILLALWIRGIL